MRPPKTIDHPANLTPHSTLPCAALLLRRSAICLWCTKPYHDIAIFMAVPIVNGFILCFLVAFHSRPTDRLMNVSFCAKCQHQQFTSRQRALISICLPTGSRPVQDPGALPLRSFLRFTVL